MAGARVNKNIDAWATLPRISSRVALIILFYTNVAQELQHG